MAAHCRASTDLTSKLAALLAAGLQVVFSRSFFLLREQGKRVLHSQAELASKLAKTTSAPTVMSSCRGKLCLRETCGAASSLAALVLAAAAAASPTNEAGAKLCTAAVVAAVMLSVRTEDDASGGESMEEEALDIWVRVTSGTVAPSPTSGTDDAPALSGATLEEPAADADAEEATANLAPVLA